MISNKSIIDEIKKILNCIFFKKKNSNIRNILNNLDGISLITKFKIFIIENQGNLKDIITLGISLANISNQNNIFEFIGQTLNLKLYNNCKNSYEKFFLDICLSFSFVIIETIEGEYLLLTDANNYEEYISICKLTIILSAKNDIVSVICGVGSCLDENIIKEAIRISFKKNYETIKLLKNALINTNHSAICQEILLIND